MRCLPSQRTRVLGQGTRAQRSCHSILVTSNLPFGRWGETFSDDVVAAAMIDRLVHHAEVLTLTGDSYRTRSRRELLTKDRYNT